MITVEHIDRFFERFEHDGRRVITHKYRLWNYFGNEEFNNEIISMTPLPSCIEIVLCYDAIAYEIQNEIILPNTELYDHITSYFIAEKLKT